MPNIPELDRFQDDSDPNRIMPSETLDANQDQSWQDLHTYRTLGWQTEFREIQRPEIHLIRI
jgi:hypothetical protein